MFRAHIGAQFSILIIPHFALFLQVQSKSRFRALYVRHRVRGLFTSPAARERTSRRHKSEQFGLKLIIKN